MVIFVVHTVHNLFYHLELISNGLKEQLISGLDKDYQFYVIIMVFPIHKVKKE